MDEKKQITEQEFLVNQQFESLARQNAQQAVRIAQLESQIALIQAKSQQPEQPQAEEVSDEDYDEVISDTVN